MNITERINNTDYNNPSKRLACVKYSDTIFNLQSELYKIEREEKDANIKHDNSLLSKLKEKREIIEKELNNELDNYDSANCTRVSLSNMDELRFNQIKSSSKLIIFLLPISLFILLLLFFTFGYETFMFITTSINHYTFTGYISLFIFLSFLIILIFKKQ